MRHDDEAAALIESLQAELVDLEAETNDKEDIYRDRIRELSTQLATQTRRGDEWRTIAAELQEKLLASQARGRDARNELCLKCGKYREAHNGACDGCRWKE